MSFIFCCIFAIDRFFFKFGHRLLLIESIRFSSFVLALLHLGDELLLCFVLMRILFSWYFGDLKFFIFEGAITVIFFGFDDVDEGDVFGELCDIVGFECEFSAVFGTGDEVVSFDLTYHGIDATLAVGVSAGSEESGEILITELVTADVACEFTNHVIQI